MAEGEDLCASPTLPLDRRPTYIIDDNKDVEIGAFFEKSSFTVRSVMPQQLGRLQVTEVTVQEYGTEKMSQIIRYQYSTPRFFSSAIET